MKNILINSTLAFVSAFIITTLLHESGHYLAYSLYGVDATLYHNYVRAGSHQLDTMAIVTAVLAGPVVSLIQATVCSLLIAGRRKKTAGHLLLIWLSLLGFVNFFGYLMLTPLSAVGDTGRAAELLNIAVWIRVVIAGLGFAALLLVIRKIAKNFAGFIVEQNDMKQRAKYVYNLMFFPIIIGSILNTLLALPAVVILSLIYPATSPYVIMSSFGVILSTVDTDRQTNEVAKELSKPLLFLLLAAVLLNRLLTLGFG